MSHTLKTVKFALIPVLAAALLCGCGQCNLKNKKDVIAYVNKDPIYAWELKRDIALRSRMDPAFKVTPETLRDQLDNIINKKLIVQAAMKKGLAREDRFVNSIKSFWEQALIRDFISLKKKDFADYLFVTNSDIEKYYNNLGRKVTFKVIKSADKRIIDKAYGKYAKNKDVTGWQDLGPVGYEDISDEALLSAFNMEKGQAGKFDDGSNYYAIEVVEVEKVNVEPLEAIRSDVEKRVIAEKERRLFDNWLSEKKKASSIKIDQSQIKGSI